MKAAKVHRIRRDAVQVPPTTASTPFTTASPTINRFTAYEALPELLRVDEAAAWLGCSAGTVYSMIQRRELEAAKLGRLVRVQRFSLRFKR